jgi:predicted nucleic-acid-binding protein
MTGRLTGLDTNILVRYFVRDDETQTRAADHLLEALSADEPAWISQIVLVELVWVLKLVYRFEREKIAGILDTLLRSKELLIEQEEIAHLALSTYRKSRADFADCLISAAGRAAGCAEVVTFDRVAARDAGMKLLTD